MSLTAAIEYKEIQAVRAKAFRFTLRSAAAVGDTYCTAIDARNMEEA